MTGVIYADVLFLINVYITYALLMLTSLFLGLTPSRVRMLFAAVVGGVSSFIIFIPELSNALSGLIRLVLCQCFCIIAFSFGGIRQLVRQSAVFLGVNFLLAGLMFGLWYFVSTSAGYISHNLSIFASRSFSLASLSTSSALSKPILLPILMRSFASSHRLVGTNTLVLMRTFAFFVMETRYNICPYPFPSSFVEIDFFMDAIAYKFNALQR